MIFHVTVEYAEIDTSILEVFYHWFLEYKQVCSLDLLFLPQQFIDSAHFYSVK